MTAASIRLILICWQSYLDKPCRLKPARRASWCPSQAHFFLRLRERRLLRGACGEIEAHRLAAPIVHRRFELKSGIANVDQFKRLTRCRIGDHIECLRAAGASRERRLKH